MKLVKPAGCLFLMFFFTTVTIDAGQPAISNPLVTFDTLLFAGLTHPKGTPHMTDQYYGWNAANGGGIYLLTGIQSGATRCIDLLENAMVTSGRFKGKKLAGGAFLSPDLSFDGKTVLFSWTNEEDQCYHIFKVNIDGSGLKQLTDGKSAYNQPALSNVSQNDFDPCWLPNGRIAFISERRGGYLRCSGGRPGPTYTLYSMKADGSDLFPLSFHETNEWHPSVTNDGMLVYTRWDYIDRDDCIAHHIWTCYPDGRNPRAPHGNYPLPLSTFGTKGWDGRVDRPIGEFNIRSIPNSDKYVATAATHHNYSFGDLVLIDVNVPDNGKMSQLTGITTGAQKWTDDISQPGPYGTAWPLSEEYFICSYNGDIVLLDRSGKKETIVRKSDVPGKNIWRLADPIPVASRDVPPVIPTATWQGERKSDPAAPQATIYVNNVYVTDKQGTLPDGVTVRWMRIIQIFPQPQATMNKPVIGYASESLVRIPLGVVPVEEDGSVYCVAPVNGEIYFQLLDEKGMAVQSMRSGTYVHPGEQMSCVGCHEDPLGAPPNSPAPMALQRLPSPIKKEVSDGAIPFNWHVLVKPVLQKNCVPCHTKEGKGPDMSYASLKNFAFFWPYWSATTAKYDVYVNGEIVESGSRSTPGRFGAHESKLYKDGHLGSGHHDVSLTDEEFRRITLWLDCNSNELGAYTKVDAQLKGELVWPELDIDPDDFHDGEVAAISRQVKSAARQPPVSYDQMQIISLNGQVIRIIPCRSPGGYDAGMRLVNKIFGRGMYIVKLSGRNGCTTRRVAVAH